MDLINEYRSQDEDEFDYISMHIDHHEDYSDGHTDFYSENYYR